MIDDLTIGDVPLARRRILVNLVGKEIRELIRFSWLPGQQASKDYELRNEDVFSLTAGPCLLKTSGGLEVAFASDPGLASVIVWVERTADGVSTSEPLASDADLHAISVTDATFSSPKWASLVGKTIASVTILKRRPENSLLEEKPNEVGVDIGLDDGQHVIFGHGLHDDSDDFAVIRPEQIAEQVRGQLDAFPLEPNF